MSEIDWSEVRCGCSVICTMCYDFDKEYDYMLCTVCDRKWKRPSKGSKPKEYKPSKHEQEEKEMLKKELSEIREHIKDTIDRAISNGKVAQCFKESPNASCQFLRNGGWMDCRSFPCFHSDLTYRIKPVEQIKPWGLEHYLKQGPAIYKRVDVEEYVIPTRFNKAGIVIVRGEKLYNYSFEQFSKDFVLYRGKTTQALTYTEK